ncbi:MAG: hypothetical protein HRU09_20030 [Oligoflexales bacterium]|nr:hypothetical protein [Oligoflexales bacterium]
MILMSISNFSSFAEPVNPHHSNRDYQSHQDIRDYSINFLCINKEENLDQEFICNKKFIDKLLKSSANWKEQDSDAPINIWFDSKTISEDALHNSQKLLQPNHGIQLRDIRDIGIVQLNSNIFSPKMPLYFRIDLLKLVICNHQISDDDMDSAIFADIEVQPMDKSELFSSEYFSKLLRLEFNGTGPILLTN